MTGSNVVTEIVNILVSGITQLGTGIGSGVANFIQSLAFTTTGSGENATTEMSVFFVLIVVFAGVALAIGLTTKLFNWLSSLGN